MEQIKVLCRRHTDLSEADMEILERYATALQTIADMEEADIFLDCPTRDGDAIVVAEAKPKNGASAYRSSVVGMMATAEHEPAVARTFRLGVATRQMKAVTQERSNVIQTVEPIRNYGRVIGVLIREKRDDCQMVSPILHLSEQSMQHMTDFIARVVDEHSWLPECIDEALLIVSNDGVITFRNTLARDLYRKLGYVEDILGKISGVGRVEVMLTLQSSGEKVLASDSTLRYSGSAQAPDDYERAAETVLISGGVCAQGEVLTKPLTEYVQENAFAGRRIPTPPVRIASLGSDAGLIGAACLVS